MSKRGIDSVASTTAEWLRIVEHPLPDVIGCYKNGRYANESVARAAFPHQIIVTYDVNGSAPTASIRDLEPGNGGPEQGPPWARRYKGSLPVPGLYGSASSVASLITHMLDAGFKRSQFLIQSAHYTFTEHICGPGTCGYPQADSTQWADKGRQGQNTDRVIYGDHFFGEAPAPADDLHYGWLLNKGFLIFGNRYGELATVKEYDRLRATQTLTKHPNRLRLAVLRARLRLLAGRLWRVAHKLPDRPDSWGKDHKGVRYQMLIKRANGERFV